MCLTCVESNKTSWVTVPGISTTTLPTPSLPPNPNDLRLQTYVATLALIPSACAGNDGLVCLTGHTMFSCNRTFFCRCWAKLQHWASTWNNNNLVGLSLEWSYVLAALIYTSVSYLGKRRQRAASKYNCWDIFFLNKASASIYTSFSFNIKHILLIFPLKQEVNLVLKQSEALPYHKLFRFLKSKHKSIR